MAQSRGRAATPRSASAPPGCERGAQSRSCSKAAIGRRGSGGSGSGQEDAELPTQQSADSPAAGDCNASRASPRHAGGASGSADAAHPTPFRQGPLRHTEPQGESDLPADEDFVEGGVELSPKSADVAPAPKQTQLLSTTWPASLSGDGPLADFWPPGAGTRALFLDYDGTLREFEPRPEQATPTEEIMELLRAINEREDVVPHIISGRDAKFLEDNFGTLSRFTLIAEHGFQIWRPGSDGWNLCDHPDGLDREHDDWKAIVHAEMHRLVDAVPGSHVEEKASSLVWHFREAEDEAAAEAIADEAVEALETLRDREKIHKIRISHGHKVVEVSYRKVRKGPVMRRVCEEKAIFGEPFLSVLVAGDDVSDESMFELAPDDTLTIKVGPAPTSARFRVGSPAQLREFLRVFVLSDTSEAARN